MSGRPLSRSPRLAWGKTFTLGLGFLAISMVWTLYNSYMPIFYSEHLSLTWQIGLVMTMDNIAAILLQPYFGALSDKRRRWGRRLPFLLIGMPIGGALFALVPFLRGHLLLLLAATIVMNLAMTTFRSPTIALMPDITPSELRSKANGVINLMGGLGALLVFFVGSLLYRAAVPLPFILVGGLLFVIPFTLKAAIKEPDAPFGAGDAGQGQTTVDAPGLSGADASDTDDAGPHQGKGATSDRGRPSAGIIRTLLRLPKEQDKSALWLLVAVWLWFMAYQPVEALFTLHGVNRLGIDEAGASLLLGFFSLSFLMFALPAGYVGQRLGRKRTISMGLAGLVLVFLGLAVTVQLWPIRILLLVGGFCWALVNINSYPMVADMAPRGMTGTYTGLYYFFSSVAAIAGPPLAGAFVDAFGWGFLFPATVGFFVLAFLVLQRVTKGEAVVRGAALTN